METLQVLLLLAVVEVVVLEPLVLMARQVLAATVARVLMLIQLGLQRQVQE